VNINIRQHLHRTRFGRRSGTRVRGGASEDPLDLAGKAAIGGIPAKQGQTRLARDSLAGVSPVLRVLGAFPQRRDSPCSGTREDSPFFALFFGANRCGRDSRRPRLPRRSGILLRRDASEDPLAPRNDRG